MSVEELTRLLSGPGNGLGDIYSIPIEALGIPTAPATSDAAKGH